MNVMLNPGERIDDLLTNNLKIIQDSSAFCFSLDAVLLSHFATVRSGDRIVDLGTGTGVIPLLVSTRAAIKEATGVEIQARVAERAARSIKLNGLEETIRIVQGDLREIKDLLPNYRADLVTCNPPYLPVGSGEISPKSEFAVARHEVCCELADVAQAASRLLTTGGRAAIVHRPARLAEIFDLFRGRNLEPKLLRFVHPEQGKAPNMVLVEFVRDARPYLKVLPPLLIYEAGAYTPEVLQIYYPEGGVRR